MSLKKGLALLLCLALCLSLLPAAAFAEGDEPGAPKTVSYTFTVDGEPYGEAQLVKDGDTLVKPADPEAPEGQVFVGWFVGETQLFSEGDTELVTVTEDSIDVTVAARFEIQEPAPDPEPESNPEPSRNGDGPTVVETGNCGDNLTWTLYDTGALVIEGSGEMTSSPWVPTYTQRIVSLSLPEGLTGLCDYAFDQCFSLTSVTIPASVSSLGENFRSCTSLTGITVDPNNPNYMDVDGVVFNKTETTLILCPAGMSGSYTIPADVTSIGESAFYGCSALTGVTIPASVTQIGDCAFVNCSSLSEIVVPAGVTQIGLTTFGFCRALQSVTLPEGLEEIADCAFMGCSSLTSLTIPASVTSIGNAFDCPNMTSIQVAAGSQNFQSIDGVVYSADGTVLRFCPNGKSGSFTIPASVTSIGDNAFMNCSALTGVTIQAGVTSIGVCAFQNCSGLTTIELPTGVTSIGEQAFYWCTSLTSFTIPASVTSIGDYAFDGCNALADVTFTGTEDERAAVVGGWSTEGNNPFFSASWHYAASNSPTVVAEGFAGDCSWTLDSEGCLTFSDGSWLGWYTSADEIPWANYKDQIVTVVFGNGINVVPQYAFSGCTALEAVSIPNGVTNIDNYAFCGCTAMEIVFLPSGLLRIGDCAFCGCSALEAISIPASVTQIGGAAFGNCASLQGFELYGTPGMLFGSIFYNDGSDGSAAGGCPLLQSAGPLGEYPYDYAYSWTDSIPDCAFMGMDALTDLTIPASVTQIGDRAVAGCSALTDIWFGGTQNEWDALMATHAWGIGDTEAAFFSATVHCAEEPQGEDQNLASNDLLWDNCTVGDTRIVGGTAEDPVRITVKGDVTITGHVELTGGYVEIVPDETEPGRLLVSQSGFDGRLTDHTSSAPVLLVSGCVSIRNVSFAASGPAGALTAVALNSDLVSLDMSGVSVTGVGKGLTVYSNPCGAVRLSGCSFSGCQRGVDLVDPEHLASPSLIFRAADCSFTDCTQFGVRSGPYTLQLERTSFSGAATGLEESNARLVDCAVNSADEGGQFIVAGSTSIGLFDMSSCVVEVPPIQVAGALSGTINVTRYNGEVLAAGLGSYAITQSDVDCFHYDLDAEQSGNISDVELVLSGSEIRVERTLSDALVWHDGEQITAARVTGSQDPEQPVIITVEGAVTLCNPIRFSGYVELVSDDDLPGSLSPAANLPYSEALLTTDGGLVLRGLSIDASEAELVSVVAAADNAESVTLDGTSISSALGNALASTGEFSMCTFTLTGGSALSGCRYGVQAHESADILVDGATVSGCSTALHWEEGSCTLLSGTIENNGVAFDSGCYPVIGDLYLEGGVVQENTNDFGTVSITLHISGAPQIGPIDLTNRSGGSGASSRYIELMIDGPLSGPVSLTNCSDELVAVPPWDGMNEVYSYQISQSDVDCLIYEPSAAETTGGLESALLALETRERMGYDGQGEEIVIEYNVVVLQRDTAANLTLQEDESYGEVRVVGSNAPQDPFLVYVDGDVTLDGALTITGGAVEICPAPGAESSSITFTIGDYGLFILGGDENGSLRVNGVDLIGGGAQNAVHDGRTGAYEQPLTLENLSITGFEGGRAVWVSERSAATLRNVVIDNCGDGVASVSTEPCVLDHCRITNTDIAVGLAADLSEWITSGPMRLNDCVITGNGTGVRLEVSDCVLIDCRVEDNIIDLFGGIYSLGGLVRIGKVDLFSGAETEDIELWVESALTEGSSITVCNAADRLVAQGNRWNFEVEHQLTAADAACFHYEESAAELAGNGVYSQPYLDAANNRLVIDISYKAFVDLAALSGADGYTIAPAAFEDEGEILELDAAHAQSYDNGDGRGYFLIYDHGCVWFSFTIGVGYCRGSGFGIWLGSGNAQALEWTTEPPVPGVQNGEGNEGEVIYFAVSAEDQTEISVTGVENVGECTVLRALSLVFDDVPKLKYYANVPASLAAEEGAYLGFFDTAGNELGRSLVSDGVAGTYKDEACTCFYYSVLPRFFESEIRLRVFHADGTPAALSAGGEDCTAAGFPFSLNDYAETMEVSGSTPEMRALAAALDDYGAAAVSYFGTGSSATSAAVNAVTYEMLDVFAAQIGGELPTGITKAQMSVMFETDNSIRVYFVFDASSGRQPGDYSYTIDGSPAELRQSGGRYYLTVTGIAAKKLDDAHTFAVTDGEKTYTVTASALSYAQLLARYGTRPGHEELCKALYLYAKAANINFGEVWPG